MSTHSYVTLDPRLCHFLNRPLGRNVPRFSNRGTLGFRSCWLLKKCALPRRSPRARPHSVSHLQAKLVTSKLRGKSFMKLGKHGPQRSVIRVRARMTACVCLVTALSHPMKIETLRDIPAFPASCPVREREGGDEEERQTGRQAAMGKGSV